MPLSAFALNAGRVATGTHNLGLVVPVPCQELVTISACESHPGEKAAKTRERECGEKKHGFPHRIPGSGHYLDLAHKDIERRVASSVNALGAGAEAVPGCSMLSRMSTRVRSPGRKESPGKPGNPAELWEHPPSGSACAVWLFGSVLETRFLWPPLLRFANVST